MTQNLRKLLENEWKIQKKDEGRMNILKQSITFTIKLDKIQTYKAEKRCLSCQIRLECICGNVTILECLQKRLQDHSAKVHNEK